MLIGISGKIGSGKDTFSRLLIAAMHFAHYKCEPEDRDIEWCAANIINSVALPHVYIKRFAGPLKNIVSYLTGCMPADLEKEDFKNSPLPKIWQSEHYTTYRQMLQYLATDVFRAHDKDFHVKALSSQYKPVSPGGRHWQGHAISISEPEASIMPTWIIADVRFPNEVQAIKENGGLVIRIKRRCIECGILDGHNKDITHTGKISFHESETALDDYLFFDAVIENTGTLEDLYKQAAQLLNQIKAHQHAQQPITSSISINGTPTRSD